MAAWRAGEASWLEQRRRRLRGFLPPQHPGLTDPAALDRLFLEWTGHYESCWIGYDAAARALESLRSAGLLLAVLTNGAAKQQYAKLALLGLADLAGPVIAAVGLGSAKPDARAFQRPAMRCRWRRTPPSTSGTITSWISSERLQPA